MAAGRLCLGASWGLRGRAGLPFGVAFDITAAMIYPVLVRRVVFCARHLLLGLLLALMLLNPLGCSLFVSSEQPVTIKSSDPSARIFVNGQEVGVGTAVVQLRRNRNHQIRAETADGRFDNKRIYREVSTTGILDVIGGVFFLVPFLGVLGPGFWSLGQDYLHLDPRQPPAGSPATQPAP